MEVAMHQVVNCLFISSLTGHTYYDTPSPSNMNINACYRLTFVHSFISTFLYRLGQIGPIDSSSEVLQQLGHGSWAGFVPKAADRDELKIWNQRGSDKLFEKVLRSSVKHSFGYKLSRHNKCHEPKLGGEEDGNELQLIKEIFTPQDSPRIPLTFYNNTFFLTKFWRILLYFFKTNWW